MKPLDALVDTPRILPYKGPLRVHVMSVVDGSKSNVLSP